MSTGPARQAPEDLGIDKLITVREIRAKFRLGRTAGYELVHRPGFPAPIVVSPRSHRWLESEVNAFAEALRVPGPDPDAARRAVSPDAARRAVSSALRPANGTAAAGQAGCDRTEQGSQSGDRRGSGRAA